MGQPILRVEAVQLAGPHEVRLRFNDGTTRQVDLLPVLNGPIFLPLRDTEFFSRVALDPVAGTVVWPNGADFAPEYLRDLPEAPERLLGTAGRALPRPAKAGKVADKPKARGGAAGR